MDRKDGPAYKGCTFEYHQTLRDGSLEFFRSRTTANWEEERPEEIIGGEVYEATHFEYRNCIFCLGTIGYDLLRNRSRTG